MAKLVSLLLLIVFSLVALGGFYYYDNFINIKYFTLIRAEGKVSFSETENGDYTQLSDREIELKSGNFIKTGNPGFAYVVLPDNSLVSIGKDATVQINVKGNSVDISQLAGSTWNRVKTVAEGGEFKVETPNTTAAVRGTIFCVDVDKDLNSEVYVQESNVDVESFDTAEGGNQTNVSDANIGEGEYSKISPKKKFKFTKEDSIPDSLKQKDWYKKNKIIDELINDFKSDDYTNFRLRFLRKLKARKDFAKIRHLFINHFDLQEEEKPEEQTVVDVQVSEETKKANPQIDWNCFQSEMSALFNKYLNPKNYKSDAEFCRNYIATKDPQSITDQFIAVENKYGVPHDTSAKYDPQIDNYWTDCQDGILGNAATFSTPSFL